MPKLDKKTAKRVNEAESGDFKPIPEDVYRLKLKAVHDTDPKTKQAYEGPAGPYWRWDLEVVETADGDAAHAKRLLFVNTSLSEASDWKMKEMFEAFGYEVDSDTDEMVDEECLAVVSQTKITKGARKGQLTNSVDKCMPLDTDLEAAGASGGDDGEPPF